MKDFFDNIKADTLFLKGNYREAYEHYFRGAVELHDSRAAFDLAYMYHQGIYVPRNYRFARDFYFAASNMENGAPLFNLALMNIRGLGMKPDLRIAFTQMKQAAEMGCVDAQMYLGTAYTLGCVFDPLNIECISMIPFYRVIHRKENLMLRGVGDDPELENERYSIIDPDEYEATQMFAKAAAQEDDTYISPQIGHARVLLGQALIEGFGSEYDPREGYRLISQAAFENDSKEASAFLVAHGESAIAYGISPSIIKYLGEQKE